jgi:signal transduction histidine kinase
MELQEQDLFKVIIAGTLLILFLGGCVVFFVIMYKRRQTNYKNEKYNLEQKFQQEMLRTQLEIREQTLKYIGQEIHDNIGQTLSLAKLHLNTWKGEGSEEKIATTKDLVSKAIHDLRALSKTLNAEAVMAKGLLHAVQSELDTIERTGMYKTRLTTEGLPYSLGTEKEIFLFRIVQEAINNIIKHAQATFILVEVQYVRGLFRMHISDNGVGFGAPEQAAASGSGLLNMHHRAALLRGTFGIETAKGKGTKICITIPTHEV